MKNVDVPVVIGVSAIKRAGKSGKERGKSGKERERAGKSGKERKRERAGKSRKEQRRMEKNKYAALISKYANKSVLVYANSIVVVDRESAKAV